MSTKTTTVIDMNHGSGGRQMSELVESIFLRHFNNEFLDGLNDFAALPGSDQELIVSTDSYVVSPLFFPGGNIGDLAVNGTVNDVSMSGGVVQWLSNGFILEEGFPVEKLEQIVQSMAAAARRASVKIVTGDTKVVQKGHGDGVYINTTGFGFRPKNISISAAQAKIGDHIIVSGPIGDHGIAILSQRQALHLSAPIQSDTAPLNGLVQTLMNAYPQAIHCLKDPTRGGLGVALNEIAYQSHVGIHLSESAVPIRNEVRSTCELTGLDPYYMANEGRLIVFCAPQFSESILDLMKQHEWGTESAVIGEVVQDSDHLVSLKTAYGSSRYMHWPSGEQLPRIC